MLRWSLQKINAGMSGLSRAVAIDSTESTIDFDLHFSFSDFFQKNFLLSILLGILLSSAFGTIYIKDMNRRLMGQLQQNQSDAVMLHNQYTQLLLEQSSLDNQARIQSIATNEGMVFPKNNNTMTVEE